ncbi:hypothetical protein [Candidatus Nanohalococcus occultus]|uniref:Uncharacterized protein n=1 Tax=Candidatus Nanohalococcus occultus TaxID=2978047 RepID=A0ABY8CES0_9ARCH|nr:hypothetical protein SVXNc_0699 [Candidatus Nanohaloarchaeota archaeon SVXNc]
MNNIKVSKDSGLSSVLAGSLNALKHNPVLFFPKLVSTFLGALWFVAVFDAVKTPETSLMVLPVILVSTVILLFVGLSASVMVSSMVEMRERYSDLALLKQGAYATAGKVSDILVSVIGLVVFMITVYMIAVLGFVAYYMTQRIVFLAAGLLISFILVMASGFYLYFLPVSLFEKDSWKKALRDSSSFSSENSRDVGMMMVFSLVLLAPAFYFTGRLETLGYVGFIVSRMVSGLVNTYVFTLGPEYYLGSQGLD